MTHGMGTLDFFLLEAGEYLERLDALAQPPAGPFPNGDEFLRIARAFRGSAIMANQHGMARAAQGIESCARAVKEGRLAWTEAVRGELIRAVDDCKVLMRRLRTPEQGDTEKAEAIGIRLDRMSGRASAALRATQGPGLDAGARAFVAREAAAIASVLQQAARSMRSDPGGRDVLAAIGPAMSALRGVAILNDLPPLGDILSAVESAVKDVHGTPGAVAPDVPEVFDAGARALARAAREVVDVGRPAADSEEARAFAARLFAMVPSGGATVPVESLFYDDAGPHVVQQGRAPAGSGAGFARVELVSQGEYLNAAYTELSRAGTAVQRDLRLFGVAANLKSLTTAGGAPLAGSLGNFASALREAVGRGAASASLDAFLTQLRSAAETLSAAQSGEEQQLASRLGEVAAAIARLPAPAAAPAPPPITHAPAAPTPPSAAAAPAARPAAAPPPAAAQPPKPAAAPAPAAAPVLGEADLATSYLTLEQLIAERGLPLGVISELTGAAAPAAPAAPAPAASTAPTGDADVVPIESLLYGSDAALKRLAELRPALLAAASKGGDPRLNEMIREVLDLVELGFGAGR